MWRIGSNLLCEHVSPTFCCKFAYLPRNLFHLHSIFIAASVSWFTKTNPPHHKSIGNIRRVRICISVCGGKSQIYVRTATVYALSRRPINCTPSSLHLVFMLPVKSTAHTDGSSPGLRLNRESGNRVHAPERIYACWPFSLQRGNTAGVFFFRRPKLIRGTGKENWSSEKHKSHQSHKYKTSTGSAVGKRTMRLLLGRQCATNPGNGKTLLNNTANSEHWENAFRLIFCRAEAISSNSKQHQQQ